MALPARVTLREVGAREGFQTLPEIVPTAKKIELIDALSETGVRHIEVASFVRTDRMPQMADAEEVVRGFRRKECVEYTGLYLNIQGFERAESLGRLDNVGWINIAASDEFLRRNSNTTADEVIESIPEWIEAFRRARKPLHGLMLSTAFGSNYEGAIPSEQVMGILERIMERIESCGAELREICLADTMGWATPEMMKRLIQTVRERYPGPEVSLHLHDTRGAGIANVYAGLQEGIEIIDASVGGLGGCPYAKGAAGNVCTEDVVFLCHEMGVETGIDLDAYIEAAKLAERIVGTKLPGSVYRSVKMPR